MQAVNVTGLNSDRDVFRDRTLLAGSVELFLFGVVLLSCCCLTFFCFCTSCACFVKHYIPPAGSTEPTTTEAPSEERPVHRDKPPPYDEVEDGLPSYQEAVRRASAVTVTCQSEQPRESISTISATVEKKTRVKSASFFLKKSP